MNHHTKDKGDIGATQAIADLTRKGYVILTPTVSEHLRFDFVAYKDNKFYRIQSKYSTKGAASSGAYTRKYTAKDFDYYSIYIPDKDVVIYPSIKFAGSRFSTTVPNSAKPFYWYEDFLSFTDKAKKRNFKSFNKTLVYARTPLSIAAGIARRKVPRISKKKLETMLWKMPTTHIAKKLGISDTAVAKWAKIYGIPKPPRGYWTKQKRW